MRRVCVASIVAAERVRSVKLALFSAGSSVSAQYGPLAVKAGCVVVDNSSFFRMDPMVPLVVPEINAEDLRMHKGIVANPNCTTAITLMALYPLHQRFGCRRVFASSYQAVSVRSSSLSAFRFCPRRQSQGTGAKAIDELRDQVTRLSSGDAIAPPQVRRRILRVAGRKLAQCRSLLLQVYAHQIAFNVIPHVDVFMADGYTKEELKMVGLLAIASCMTASL